MVNSRLCTTFLLLISCWAFHTPGYAQSMMSWQQSWDPIREHILKTVKPPKPRLIRSTGDRDNPNIKALRPLFRCIEKPLMKNFQAVTVKFAELYLQLAYNGITSPGSYPVRFDEEYMSNLVELCRHTRKHLPPEINDLNDLSDAEKADIIENLLEAQTHPKQVNMMSLVKAFSLNTKPYVCQLDSIEASVAIVVGIGIGVNQLRCLYPNGKVRRYIGPQLGIKTLLLGANISHDRYYYSQSEQDRVQNLRRNPPRPNMRIRSQNNFGLGISKLAALYFHNFRSFRSDKTFLITHLGLGAVDIERPNHRSVPGFSVGLGVGTDSTSFGSAGIRFFNGSRRWNWLIDMMLFETKE